MTREEFDKLVRQVEDGVGRNPAALQRRVLRLALLGYAGLLFWLLIIVFIAASFFLTTIWVDTQGKIICGLAGGLILLGGGWAALQALLVKVTPPTGRKLTREEVPALFMVLDDLRQQLRSAPFHDVLVIGECNAAVVQVPRLGVLGWSRNYLLLGLPLLDGLSPEEMRAVLAHEFAHLSREHGRLSHWLYRLRRSWEELFHQLARAGRPARGRGQSISARFIGWFWPKFNAHAFVLSRANEYEADAQAGRLVGRDALASALVRLRFLGRHLAENTWPEVWQQANERSEPPADVFSRLRDSLRTGPAAAERARWMTEAFRTKTTNSDTHPCLTERLSALGADTAGWTLAGVATAATPTAAERLFGANLEIIRAEVNAHWAKEVEKDWHGRHARATSLNHRLTTLAQAVPNPDADADSLWDQARFLLDLKGDKNLEPLLRQILALRPDHPAANFYLGRLLLDVGDPTGETYLERVMAEDEDVLPQACTILREHHRRAGRMDKLREVETRMDRYERDLAASRKERAEFTADDVLIPHSLTESELAQLCNTLSADPQVARAELAQKRMKFFPKQRFFILCVHRWQPWHRLPNSEQDRALVNRIARAVQLPGRLLVIPPAGRYRSLTAKFRYLSGTEIYRSARAK